MRVQHPVCQASIAIALVLAAAACDTPRRAPDQDYRNFQTAVASASKDGYAPYWLGRGFTVGGLSFTGPSTADFGGEVEGGGANFSYDADVLDGGGSVSLDVTLYSPAAWDRVKAVQGAVPAPNAVVTDVAVPGGAGRLLQTRDSAGSIEQLRLVAQLGDTTVLAIALRGNRATPGPDLNPLTDKRTFISVMQNLRLYPQ
jgi:hypothetical protein